MTDIYKAIKSIIESSSKTAIVIIVACSVIIGVGHLWPHQFPQYREEVMMVAKISGIISGALIAVNLTIFLGRSIGDAASRSWKHVVVKPAAAKKATSGLLHITTPALVYLAVALSHRKRVFSARAGDRAIIELQDLGIIETNDFYSDVFTITEPAWRAMISMPEFTLPYSGEMSFSRLNTLKPAELAEHLPQMHPATIRYLEELPSVRPLKGRSGFI